MIYVYSIIIILILISFTNIRITLVLHRINEDDNIVIKIEILKFIKFKFKIPYIDIFLDKNLRPGLKIREELDTKKDEEIYAKKIILSFQKLGNLYNKFKLTSKIYKSVFNYILSKTRFDYIRLHARVGLGDAAYSAVTVGAIYAIISYVFGLINSSVKLVNRDISVVPEYSKPVLEVDFHCIIRLQIANIITAGIKMLFIFLKYAISKKGGVDNERASYSRTNENYNG